MKQIITILSLMAIALTVGWFAGQHFSSAPEGPTDYQSGQRKVLYYQAPMDSSYRRDEPGKSPMGMDLVPVYSEGNGNDDAGIVSIAPEVMNNFGIRTSAVQKGPLVRRINTVGHVTYSEDTLYKISPRVDGWVERLAVKASGDQVIANQPLFELYSPTLVNAQEEFLAVSKNTALKAAARERLQALGFSRVQLDRLERDRQVEQLLAVLAPRVGVIIDLGVREGQHITAHSEVMTIGSIDKIWIQAEVFERQAAWVEEGQTALVTTAAYPGQTWQGTVDYIYPELDPISRTLKLRLSLANEDLRLKPNMFVRARIEISDASDILYIPRSALIPDVEGNRVVKVEGKGKFYSQQVDAGFESGEFVQILRGLKANDKVVVSGQFLIDSESNMNSAMSRMADRGHADEMADDTAAEVSGKGDSRGALQ